MDRPIRILHCVIGSMNVGGIENMIMQMYRNIDRNKVQFDFLVHDYKENYYEKEIKKLGGKLYRIQHVSKNPIKHISDFIKLLKEHKEYQIIHIHTTYSIMLSDAIIAKKLGRKVIIHSHNSNAPLKRKIVHMLLKNIFSRYADYRIACSEIAAKWMFSKKKLGNVLFWPNAKRLEKYKFSQEIRNKIRIQENVENSFIIGNIGRLSYQKNQELLIEIFYEFLKENKNSVLWLIGDGEDREKLENIVKEKGIEEKVKFWGNMDNINKLLFAMDVFVLTSRYEGLALVLIEAQASGIPVVFPAHISKEVYLNENIYCVKLLEKVESWIEKINSINILQNREDAFENVNNSDFNILKWIKKVEKFYLSIGEGENNCKQDM